MLVKGWLILINTKYHPALQSRLRGSRAQQPLLCNVDSCWSPCCSAEDQPRVPPQSKILVAKECATQKSFVEKCSECVFCHQAISGSAQSPVRKLVVSWPPPENDTRQGATPVSKSCLINCRTLNNIIWPILFCCWEACCSVRLNPFDKIKQNKCNTCLLGLPVLGILLILPCAIYLLQPFFLRTSLQSAESLVLILYDQLRLDMSCPNSTNFRWWSCWTGAVEKPAKRR